MITKKEKKNKWQKMTSNDQLSTWLSSMVNYLAYFKENEHFILS